MNVRRVKKIIYGGLVSIAGMAAVVLAVSSINSNYLKSLTENEVPYTLNLNSSNAVSASGTYQMTSTTGGKVNFKYTSASLSSGNHTTLAAGGTIVNTDVIHSISNFRAVFTGTLQARIGYNSETWGDYFNLKSGQDLEFATRPYYLEMKAVTGVVLNNASFGYTCQINSDAESTVEEGTYDITFSTHESDGSGSLDTSTIMSEVASGSDFIQSFDNLAKIFPGIHGLKIGASKSNGTLTINFNQSYVKGKITTVDLSTANYGSDTGVFNVLINDSATEYTITPSSGGSITVNDTLESLTIYTSTMRAYLSGITLNYSSGQSPSTPVDVVGFTASDANKDSYTTNSIFDNDNALSVKELHSDNTQTSIAKGGENGYSYVIKNSSNEVVNSSEKFNEEGTYTLVVSYKEYLPVEITLTVGEYIYLTDVSASMNKVSFTTAEKLSENLNNNISAILSYSNGITETVQYPAFEERGVEVVLSNPKGITHTQTNPFGTAGIWTVTVRDRIDNNIKDSIDITINAIPVETISLNENSYELHPEDTLQLVATVNPVTATNSVVSWESNNAEVATVSSEGLVTAIGLGKATITCTAVDGSNVFASCSITVVAAPKPSDVGTFNLISYSELEVGQYIIFASATSGSAYAMGEQRTNNRLAVSVDISNGKIVRESTSEFRAFEVRDGISSGTFAFYDPIEEGYLSATGASKASNPNYLKIETTLSAKSSFAVNGSQLVASGYSNYCNIRFNNGNSPKIFSCYTSGQSDVYLFANTEGASTTPIYPTEITLGGTSTISVGQVSQLGVTYEPNNTNVQNVTFSSSNENVATVSNSGLVTGISSGKTTITATAEAESGTINATIDITVSNIAVASVSLDSTTASIKAGRTITLVATISPNNATNRNVTWSTSNSSIATVTDGVVKGIAAGQATITVRTEDGNKTASCTITVTAASTSSEWELVTDDSSLAAGDVIVIANSENSYTAGDISSQVMSLNNSSFSSDKTTIEELNENAAQLTLGGEEGAWTLANENGQLLGATAVKKLAWGSGTTTWSISISGGNATIQNATSSYGRFLCNTSTPRFTTYTSGTTSSMLLPQIYRGGVAEPTDPTSISLSDTSIELAAGGSKNLTVSYNPKNANQNKEVTWTSSNTSVATVNNGVVTASSNATSGQKATITAKLTNLPSITATCTVTVVEQQKDNHTVLIYICGADLESKNGLATGDIKEILKISGQPDDVNIVIETGGASSWESTYGISSSNLERYHVANRSLVRDESLTYASMGQASTLRSFIEYGLKNYPAERTGLVLWNHGGGMRGVCYDEKKNDDALLASEVSSAVSSALTNCGMSDQKLEWIGYDACLMAVQDIAVKNSQYFNYMIASEESEAGYGWDYDTWVDDLYSKKSTTTILKAIVDGFITDNGGASKSSGDQTLSYMNLSYASAYKTAWENMATQLKTKLSSSNKSTFNNAIINNVKHFGDSDYDYFCTFDAKDFINKLASGSAFSAFKIDSSYTDAVLQQFTNFVSYSVAQKGAGEAYGLCMYWPNNKQYSNVGTYYTSSETSLSTWRSICVTYGVYAN